MATNFSIITTTPGVLRNQLLARGLIQEVTVDGQTKLVGVNGGLEWVEVPNPIVTTAQQGTRYEPGYVAPVMDPRHVYLVKVADAAEAAETAGLEQNEIDGLGMNTRKPVLQRTKLGQWILNNSVPDTLTSADGRSWPARKVGNNFWLVQSDDFGVWQ